MVDSGEQAEGAALSAPIWPRMRPDTLFSGGAGGASGAAAENRKKWWRELFGVVAGDI